MQSFRASPWVSYEPSPTIHHPRASGSEMDEDVDMDAPQISTLRDDESPPPQQHKKATVTPKKRNPAATTSVETWVRGNTGVAGGEVDEEEDQLIDELIDDEENASLVKPSPSSRTSDPQKRKVSLKLKQPRKADKKTGNGEKKAKVSQPTGAQTLAPTMSIFKANPTEAHEDLDHLNSSPAPRPGDPSAPKSKKKVSPRKPPTIPRAKTKVTKQKSAIPALLLEDTGVLSESYAGTAASSPITATFEQNTPEPEIENMPPSSPPASSVPLPEEMNLENVPIPVYPLPTKPFPVQLPPKIASGFAPLIPLDKSGKQVRHWRTANREIRGIAGGRWLAKTWVGEKESDYATHASGQGKPADDKASTSVALPKLPSLSAPGPLKVSKLKGSSKSGSAATSATPSRAQSVAPDPQGIPVTSAVRAPTKMRITQQATSDAGDSEMMGPPDM